MKNLWKQLYGDQHNELLTDFLEELKSYRKNSSYSHGKPDWYKDAVVYSLYVDLFNNGFQGLTEKLDYIQELGINCLWLLPILDSPMKDAGFDIMNYRLIRKELIGLPSEAGEKEHLAVFQRFLHEAHSRDISVIFDVAINHSSDQHPWFLESAKSVDNPYRDYYIWNKDDKKYSDCRLLFKGMCPSNWEKRGEQYFFHRFFEHQPDLNYRNPKVLLEMCRNLMFWLSFGVDGFRADAIPYLWKEEGTDCENLPKTHTIVKFLRAVLDEVVPGTLLLAEACQPPKEVVKYFGDSDECHAGYHFPLMPQIFKAIELQKANPIITTLSAAVTPEIPDSCQWFTFLRCHDELSLELVYVSEEDRKFIHETYCHNPLWDFRVGEGISARMAELMEHNIEKIKLAFSIMFTLPGTPIVYYGDEFGKSNDIDYYEQIRKETGYNDTRYFVRGRISWNNLKEKLADPNSFESQMLSGMKIMINQRRKFNCFGRGKIEWLKLKDNQGNILAFVRTFGDEKVLVVHNLSEKAFEVDCSFLERFPQTDILGQEIEVKGDKLVLRPWGYRWIDY